MPPVRSVAWRLSVEGDEIAVQKLEGVGRAANKAVQPVPGILKAVSAASEEMQGKLSSLAEEAGAVGNILSAMGPIGLGVAATFGALAIAAHEAFSGVKEAEEFADQLEKTAQHVRLTTTEFQALVAAAKEYNVDQGQVVSGLDNLRDNVTKFIAGFGGGRGGLSLIFKDLGLSRQDLAGAGSFSQQLSMVADALSRVQNVQVREGLAEKLGVADLLPMLAQGSVGLHKLANDAQQTGQIMDDGLVKKGADANREIEKLTNQVDIDLKKAFVGLGVSIDPIRAALIGLKTIIADIVTSLTKVENRSTSALQQQLVGINADIAKLSPAVDDANSRGQNDSVSNRARVQLASLTQQRDQIMAIIRQRISESQESDPATKAAMDLIRNGGKQPKVTLPPSQEDIANANRAQRELDALANKEQSLDQQRQAVVDQVLVRAQQAAADRVNAENAADVEILRGKEGYYQALLKQANDARDAEIATINAREKAQLDSLDKQQAALDKLKADYAKLGKGMPNYAADTASINDARAQAQQAAQDQREAVSMRNQADQVQIYREARGSLGQLADTLGGPLKTALQDISTNELNRFTDDLTDVVTGAKSAGDAIKDMVNSIIADMARLVLERAIEKPLADALGGALDSWFGGGHAAGGAVSAGMVYRVNENGGMPETFFTPGGQGTILSGASSLNNVVNLVSRRLQPPAVAVQTAPPKVEIHNHGEPVNVASQSYDPSNNTTRIDLKGELNKTNATSIRTGGLDSPLQDRFGLKPVARRRQ